MPRAANQSAYLDAVTRARSEYVLAKTTLESRLRDELEKQLANLQTQVDIAVRYAFQNGHSKGQILKAMGTKYYGMVNESLDRTEGVAEVKGVDPLDYVYSFDASEQELSVDYKQHGPDKITGTARFHFRLLDDGTKWLFSKDPLWSADYTTRNDVVAALDNKQEGYYYEEAIQWLMNTSAR